MLGLRERPGCSSARAIPAAPASRTAVTATRPPRLRAGLTVRNNFMVVRSSVRIGDGEVLNVDAHHSFRLDKGSNRWIIVQATSDLRLARCSPGRYPPPR